MCSFSLLALSLLAACEPLTPDVVAYHLDTDHGMQRIEATCNVCDAHLGHVFSDGPPPSGLRFCMNAVSLRKATRAPSEEGGSPA